MGTYERGTDTTRALTEVRTVLGRAEDALSKLERMRANGCEYPGYLADDGELRCFEPLDPDTEEMIAKLQETVGALDRWRRTGRLKK